MKQIINLILLLLIGVMASAQTTGTFTDPRDGEVTEFNYKITGDSVKKVIGLEPVIKKMRN